MMSVSGLFLEQGPRTNQPLRSFSRVFVIVPFGAGFCIINEQLFVTNATEEQSKVSPYVLIRIYDCPVVEHYFLNCVPWNPQILLMNFSFGIYH